MKRIFLFLFSLPFISQAQIKHLTVEGSAPALYLSHTVQPKENYYSIGRLYNISPKEIAPFNNLQMEKGLSLHQVIKVPLTATNFLQTGNAGPDEVLVPVHHILQQKEGLFRVGINYNKLPLETLKKWNNIKGESVPNGTDLIIGYLKVKKELSALSSLAKTKAYDNAVVAPAPIADQVTATPSTAVTAKVTEPKKEVAIPVTTTTATAVTAKVKAPKKEVAIAPKTTKDPVFIEDIPAKAPEVENAKNTAPVVKETQVINHPINTSAKNFDGGIFKKEFDNQSKRQTAVNEAGSAATFKSNSGWEDGKYYCLHNTAPSGTVLKITNVATGKLVYAKVLDVMPDIKQNGGLLVRLSNAAAQELGVTDARFDCTVSYTK